MKRPHQRKPRNDQRLLDSEAAIDLANKLRGHVRYDGSPDHKANPRAFRLPDGSRGRPGAMLCDEHGGFKPDDMMRIPALIERSLNVGLVSERRIWVVDDNGQIYELSATNEAQHQYHGYPVHPEDGIVGRVYRRLSEWARRYRDSDSLALVESCGRHYGLNQ